MRTRYKALLAGAAVVLIGSGALAAMLSTVHYLTVQLPGGGIERISYTGDVAPKVVMLPSMVQFPNIMPMAAFWSPWANFTGGAARIDRLDAATDRDMTRALQEANAMANMPFAGPNGLADATVKSMPAGSESFSFVSSMFGNNFCSREVQITTTGNGAKPKIVSHTSGNCMGGTAPNASALFQDTPSNTAPLVNAKVPLQAGTDASRQHI